MRSRLTTCISKLYPTAPYLGIQSRVIRFLLLHRVIDRASKRGNRVGGSSRSSEICIAGRTVSDEVFFLGALGVFAVGSVASWGRVYALAMASAGVAGRLRTRLFKALMLQEKGFFDSNKAGELAPVLAEVRADIAYDNLPMYRLAWAWAVREESFWPSKRHCMI